MKCGNVHTEKGKWHSQGWKIDCMRLNFKWDDEHFGIFRMFQDVDEKVRTFTFPSVRLHSFAQFSRYFHLTRANSRMDLDRDETFVICTEANTKTPLESEMRRGEEIVI